MRTRTRTSSTTLEAGTYLQYRSLNPNSFTTVDVNTTSPSVTYTSFTETMVDQQVRKLSSGAVTHSKVTTNLYPGTVAKYDWFLGGTYYRSTFGGSYLLWHSGISGNYNNWLNPSVTLSAPDWGQLSYQAMNAMRPSLDKGLLLPNFILELAEAGFLIRERVHQGIKRAERARQLAAREAAFLEKHGADALTRRNAKLLAQQSVARTSIWSRSARYIGKVAKWAAWVNLGYQFAVRPTVSDAKKIYSIIKGWRTSLAELIRRAGILQVAHYTRPLDLITPPVVTTKFGPSPWMDSVETVKCTFGFYSRPVYHASMLYTYDASRLNGLLGKFDAALNAFGINRIASVIWEAIPFSFIVDWFVNVSDMLRGIEDSLFADPLPIIVHDFSHSVKYAYRTSLDYSMGTRLVYPGLAVRTTSYYERRREVPSLWDALSVRSPNLNQTGLGLSLIIMRMDGVTRDRRKPGPRPTKPLNFNKAYFKDIIR